VNGIVLHSDIIGIVFRVITVK